MPSLLAVLVVAAFATCAQAIITSTNGSIDVLYSDNNGNAPVGAADLPLQALARSVYGVAPDQIHVTFWGNSSYLISWATGDGQVGPGVVPPPTSGVKSCVLSGRNALLNDSTTTMNTGIALTYVYDYSQDVTEGQLGADYINLPGQTWLAADYASPLLHHVLLEGLLPKTTYFYQVGDPRFYYGMSSVFNFTTMAVNPPNATFNGTHQLPFRLGIFADVGQTYNTTEMQGRMMAAKFDALALIGDFTYSDNYGADGCLYYDWHGSNAACPWSLPEGTVGEQTYQPRWDTWARLWQPVLSGVPLLFTNGNHELEELPSGARFTSLNARYVGPPAAGVYPKTLTNQMYLRTVVTPSQFADNEFDPLASFHNMFYSVELPGVTKIFLTTFIGSDDFSNSTLQWQWLKKTLAAVNRVRTPWVIVSFHFPMYSSFKGPYKGNECFRQSYEPLFHQYGVDIVFNGHVHSYERTNPVYNLALNSCGTVHIIVGDGGNNEGVELGTIDQAYNTTGYCRPGQAETRGFPAYQPQSCFAYNPSTGEYCDSKQPVWSAYRNPSWGFGVLNIMNATTSHWVWDNTDNGSNVTDSVYLTRNTACANAGMGGDRR